MSIRVNIDVDVDLSDIETADIVDEVESRGDYLPVDTAGVDIERIRHIMLCGLVEEAKKEAWQMI